MGRSLELDGGVGDIGSGYLAGGRLTRAVQHPKDQEQEHGAEGQQETQVALGLYPPESDAVRTARFHGLIKA